MNVFNFSAKMKVTTDFSSRVLPLPSFTLHFVSLTSAELLARERENLQLQLDSQEKLVEKLLAAAGEKEDYHNVDSFASRFLSFMCRLILP